MKLKRFVDVAGNPLGYMFFCPGCKYAHPFAVEGPTRPAGPTWSFNGNLERPTFSPSLLLAKDGPPEMSCHLFLVDGKIQFLQDCAHALAGQTVDMVDFPEGYNT